MSWIALVRGEHPRLRSRSSVRGGVRIHYAPIARRDRCKVGSCEGRGIGMGMGMSERSVRAKE